MISVQPKFKSKALTLPLRASAGVVKMPLAQAHPFEPMAVTHEETLEVSPECVCIALNKAVGFLPFDTAV